MSNILDRYPQGRKPLRFDENGRFRILNVSDFHGLPQFNPKLTQAFEALLEETQPDFVFVGGDQLCNDTEEMLRDYLTKVMEPVIRRGLPWAHNYGNHDQDNNAVMNKDKIEAVYESFPTCYSTRGPRDISGVGNFCLPILAHDSDDVLYHIWAMDSFANTADYTREFGMDPHKNWNYILPRPFGAGHDQACPMFNQVVWYYTESRRYEQEYGRNIPGVMFMHVPLLEMNLLYRNPEQTNLIGRMREEPASGELNNGLFMACRERGDVRGIFFGHEHLSDAQGEYLGITLAYDSAIGYDMSTHDDMRGGRVIDLYKDGEMKTYMVNLLKLLGEKAIRNPNFFEGGEHYGIRWTD